MRIILATFFLCLLFHAPNSHGGDLSLHGDCVVSFANRTKGIEQIAQRDRFINSMSPFDRQSRLQTGETVSTDDYVKFISAHVMDWETDEVESITDLISSIKKRLQPFQLPLPKEVAFVKTSGEEIAPFGSRFEGMRS